MNSNALDDCLFRVLAGRVMFIRRFLNRLYREYPQFRMLFGDIDRVSQERTLVAAVEEFSELRGAKDDLTRWLECQAARLRRCGVEPDDYPDLSTTLLLTLAETEGPSWTEEAASACREVLGVLKAIAQHTR